MGRAFKIAFYVICFMLSLSLLHTINFCYWWGSTSNACPAESGTGHPFIPVNIQPLWEYSIKDADGNVVNVSDSASYNATMYNAAAYKTAPAGITDIFGFFSWVITAIRVVVNAFFMPLYGLPDFITSSFWIPTFVSYSLGTVLFLIQLVGLYEFASGRDVFG